MTRRPAFDNKGAHIMTFANRPERRHVVAVSDDHNTYLYGPFESSFQARLWAQRHGNDFAGRRVHVTPAAPITPTRSWFVTFDNEDEHAEFMVEAMTEADAVTIACGLLIEEGENPTHYLAHVKPA
jgi:hypothetical protein